MAGIKLPVVDSMVDALIVVPNWYLAYHRVAFANKFKMPETPTLYYNPYQLLWTWCAEEGR